MKAGTLDRGKPCGHAQVVTRESATGTDKGKAVAWPLRGVRRRAAVHGRGAGAHGQMLRAMKSWTPGGTEQSGFGSQVRKWNISGLTLEKSAVVGEKVPAPAFKVFEKNGCLASAARQCRERWGTCEPRRGCPHVLMWSGKLSTATRTEQTPALTPVGTPGGIR